jgi:hypothetical protein
VVPDSVVVLSRYKETGLFTFSSPFATDCRRTRGGLTLYRVSEERRWPQRDTFFRFSIPRSARVFASLSRHAQSKIPTGGRGTSKARLPDGLEFDRPSPRS